MDTHNYLYDKSSDAYYNSYTIYAKTNLAHAEQIKQIMDKAIEDFKAITNEDTDVNYRINHVRDYQGNYMQHAFIDVNNELFFKMITGGINEQPTIKLMKYEPDVDQACNLEGTDHTLLLSPAFIKYPNDKLYNPQQLYVNNVPNDYHFIVELFDRYNRGMTKESRRSLQVSIHPTKGDAYFALITFSCWQDASFALCMNKKITVLYKNTKMVITCRHSKNKE